MTQKEIRTKAREAAIVRTLGDVDGIEDILQVDTGEYSMFTEVEGIQVPVNVKFVVKRWDTYGTKEPYNPQDEADAYNEECAMKAQAAAEKEAEKARKAAEREAKAAAKAKETE